MKRIIAASAVLAIGLLAGSASAAPLPNPLSPNACLIGGGESTDGSGSQHCEFTASGMSGGQHGYLGLTPNDYVIWLDTNNDNQVTSGETVLAEVTPAGPGAVESGGVLTVANGAKVDVLLSEGCAGPACGWVGMLLVG